MKPLDPAPTKIREFSDIWRNWLQRIPEQEGWNAVTFENSWDNVGGAYYEAAYKQDIYGVVRLRGRIDTGTSGTACFPLPEGYRPNGTIEFVCAGFSTATKSPAYVTIDSSGVVTPTIAGTSIQVSLDGIAFIAEK